MVLEVSVLGKGMVWSLRQPLGEETQDRPLGKKCHAVFSKLMTSVVENDMLFEK